MLQIGLEYKVNIEVNDTNTAIKMGSGTLPVFSTPSMIALMENASYKLVEPFLNEGESTVGILINVNHLAASKLGDVITANSKVINIEGRKITFEVKAYCNDILIGEGTHVRVLINNSKFMSKLEGNK